MKRLFGAFVFLALVTPGLAGAVSTCGVGLTDSANGTAGLPPFAQVVVNGVCVDLTPSITQEGKLSLLRSDFAINGLAHIQVQAIFNSDPFITFGTTTTNLIPGPVTYAFQFGTPVVPGLYNHATSTGGVTVTNGASGTSTVGPSAVYPTYISGYGTVGFIPTNLGVDLGNATCTAGPGTPFTTTTTCNQGSATSTFAPTFYNNLEALVTYTQNDVASVASWSGAVTLTNERVPEPASLSLLALGAVAVAVSYRVRSRRSRD